jgi:hypothetical protein
LSASACARSSPLHVSSDPPPPETEVVACVANSLQNREFCELLLGRCQIFGIRFLRKPDGPDARCRHNQMPRHRMRRLRSPRQLRETPTTWLANGGFTEQMEVIAHEAKCVDNQHPYLDERANCVQESDPVVIIPEGRTAPGTSGHDTIDSTGKLNTDWPGHMLLPVYLRSSVCMWLKIFPQNQAICRQPILHGKPKLSGGPDNRVRCRSLHSRPRQEPNSEDLAPFGFRIFLRAGAGGMRVSSCAARLFPGPPRG